MSAGGPARAALASSGDEDCVPWHALAADEALRRLVAAERGLSPAEAHARLARHGPNVLEESPPTNPLRLLLRQFESPVIFILLVAAAVTVLLREFIDASVIAAVLALNAVIGFTQERRAESSVRALMKLVAP
jgi:Ca2+-transporting ATPase